MAPKRLRLACALLQYRPDLAGQRTKPTNLGVLMEFAAANTWAPRPGDAGGCRSRGTGRAGRSVTHADRGLPGHHESRGGRGVARTATPGRRLGDALRILAERNPWSFHVAPPQPLSISARDAAAMPTVGGREEARPAGVFAHHSAHAGDQRRARGPGRVGAACFGHAGRGSAGMDVADHILAPAVRRPRPTGWTRPSGQRGMLGAPTGTSRWWPARRMPDLPAREKPARWPI